MLSVTTVVAGWSSATRAAASATMPLREISHPLLSTAADRSTSVSKIRPRSDPETSVCMAAACMTSLFSGFGIWFRNMPSGSR